MSARYYNKIHEGITFADEDGLLTAAGCVRVQDGIAKHNRDGKLTNDEAASLLRYLNAVGRGPDTRSFKQVFAHLNRARKRLRQARRHR